MQRAPETADNVPPTALTAENIQEWKMAHLFSLQGSADEVSCDALHTHAEITHAIHGGFLLHENSWRSQYTHL